MTGMTAVIVLLIQTFKRAVPLFLPMRLGEMFHEESRFQTKRENKRREHTHKNHGHLGR